MVLGRYEGDDCHNSAVQNTEIPVNTTHRCRKYASLCVLTVRDGTLQFQLKPPGVYMCFCVLPPLPIGPERLSADLLKTT